MMPPGSRRGLSSPVGQDDGVEPAHRPLYGDPVGGLEFLRALEEPAVHEHVGRPGLYAARPPGDFPAPGARHGDLHWTPLAWLAGAADAHDPMVSPGAGGRHWTLVRCPRRAVLVLPQVGTVIRHP